jgi:hypothetical protein
MSNLTANQHYVWQHYLRAWAAPKQIWCKRLGQAEPFATTPRNVASQRFFYEFHELTDRDCIYLEQLISRSNDDGLRELNRGWVRYFQATFAIRRQLEGRNIDPALRQQLEIELLTIERTLGERYHGATEDRAVPILDAPRRGDAAFHGDIDSCSNFIQFITLHYIRTAKLRNAVLAIKHPRPHDMRRTWPVEAFIHATNVGASLFRRRHLYRVIFLRNCSNIPFIAGDQPVVSLSAAESEELDLLYPLTPDLAMIYIADRARYQDDRIDLSAIAIESYDFRIHANSDSQIYGNNLDYLKALAARPNDDRLL